MTTRDVKEHWEILVSIASLIDEEYLNSLTKDHFYSAVTILRSLKELTIAMPQLPEGTLEAHKAAFSEGFEAAKSLLDPQKLQAANFALNEKLKELQEVIKTRPTACSFCRMTFTSWTVASHHEQQCDKAP